MKINSYPKVYNLGHPAIKELFEDSVIIDEKIDGSQFSFAKINNELLCKSKGKELFINQPEKMFSRALATVIKIKDKLKEGYINRAEYLQKPKHNTLAYDRIPNNHLIIFP